MGLDYQIGTIVVTRDGIIVRAKSATSGASTTYRRSTVETVADAARVLAAWMELPSEDLRKECQRICQNDQLSAAIREIANDVVKGERDEHQP